MKFTGKRSAFSVLGILFAVLAVRPFIKGLVQQPEAGLAITEGAGVGLLSGACLILAGICFGVAFVENFSLPFTRWIDSIYTGGNDNQKPPLDFTLATRHEVQENYPAAVREYERLLEYYPHSADAWARLIELRVSMEGPEATQSTIEDARKSLRWHPAQSRLLEPLLARTGQLTSRSIGSGNR